MHPSEDALDFTHLVVDLVENEPFAFLSFAARTISTCGWHTLYLAEQLAQAETYAGESLALALRWLLGPPAPRRVNHPWILNWLVHLDLGQVLQCRRRSEDPEGNTTSYLLELELADGQVGTLHARIDHRRDGALTNVFVVDEYIDALDQLLTHASGADGKRYRPIQTPTAARALRKGLEQFDRLPPQPDPQPDDANPWPLVRPLLTFVLDHYAE